MHIQLKKKIATLMALTMSIMYLSSASLTVFASESKAITSSNITADKIIDMALTKSGVVANSDVKNSIKEQTLNVLNGTATSYRQWCADNDKGINSETWQEYLSSDAYASLGFRLSSWAIKSADFINYVITGETLLGLESDDLPQMMIGTDTVEKGNDYTISNDVITGIYNVFTDTVTNGEYGYYYVPVYSVNDISVNWFNKNSDYENIKSYVKSSKNNTMLLLWKTSSSMTNYSNIRVLDNGEEIMYIRESGEKQITYTYSSEWTSKTVIYSDYAVATGNINYTSSEEFKSANTATRTDFGWDYIYPTYATGGNTYTMFLVNMERGQQIVYNSLEALKTFNGGNKPYYMVTNKQYDDSIDNSINFTGDYIIKYGGDNSYDYVQNNINNSEDNSDNSVNNIVNDSSTTIINYYGYSENDDSASDGDSGDSDSDNGLMNVIKAIGEVLNFILNALAEVISIVADFLNSLLEILKSLGGIFTSFSGLLAELFPFIPEDVTRLLTSAISATILIAVVRNFKK